MTNKCTKSINNGFPGEEIENRNNETKKET